MAKEPAEDDLWQRLEDEPGGDAREALAERHLSLVKVCAGRLAMHLPSWVRPEDLFGAGSSGLLGAIDRFEPERGIPFEGFAQIRIRGAMLDELRSLDLLPRAARERAERLRAVEREMADGGGEPTVDAVCEKAGVSVDEYLDVERALRTSRMLSLEAVTDEEGHTARSLVADRSGEPPGASMERSELVEWAKSQLSERERQIVILYYEKELTLKEIGQVLGLTEGRVSQIHTELLGRLRRKLS